VYGNVLVPVDLSHGEVAAHILKVARWLAGSGGKITLMHVIDLPQGYVSVEVPAEILDRHRADLKVHVEALAAADGGVDRVVVVEGSPASSILAQAEESGADLIVLGSHRPGYRDFLIGSTAARVVRHAACTVLVERSWPVSA
jgi:nucleotide-binding universal stress UspA family protein